jgi:hypothetical protein
MMIKVHKVTNTNLQTAAQQRQAFQAIPGRRTDIGGPMLRLINSVDPDCWENKLDMCSHRQGKMINDDYETNYN